MLVRFTEGTYKIQGQPRSVAGTVFPLVEDYREDDKGGFITVDARGVRGFPDRNIKIRVSSANAYEPTDGDVVMHFEHVEDLASPVKE